MTEKEYREIMINKKCLEVVDRLITALEECKELEEDGDMPILYPDDDLIEYYHKVKERIIIELNNDLIKLIGE